MEIMTENKGRQGGEICHLLVLNRGQHPNTEFQLPKPTVPSLQTSLYKVWRGELSLPGRLAQLAETPHWSVVPGFNTGGGKFSLPCLSFKSQLL